MQNVVNAPTRRNLLGHVAGATVAMTIFTAATRRPPNPDTTLLALCKMAIDVAHKRQDLPFPGNDDTVRLKAFISTQNAFNAEQDRLMAQIATIPAKTTAGLNAKVGLVREWIVGYPGGNLSHYATSHERLAWSLLDDVGGRAVA